MASSHRDVSEDSQGMVNAQAQRRKAGRIRELQKRDRVAQAQAGDFVVERPPLLMDIGGLTNM